MAENGRTSTPERLRQAEAILMEADRLLQRRRAELGGLGQVEFEDRLLQGVRELAAVVRDLVAAGGGMAAVSTDHSVELAATATELGHTPSYPTRLKANGARRS